MNGNIGIFERSFPHGMLSSKGLDIFKEESRAHKDLMVKFINSSCMHHSGKKV